MNYSKDMKMDCQDKRELEQYRAIGTVEEFQHFITAWDELKILIDIAKNELSQYKSIGTVDEFKALKDGSIPIIHGKAELELYGKEIRANAIDEFAERIEKRIKEEVSLLEQERNEAREYDDEQVIFAVNNQLRAFDYSLRVIAEELKGGAV